MTNRKATIGTISHGTHRNEDMLSAFATELEYLTHFERSRAQLDLIEEARAITNFDSETATEIVHELFDALEELAPAYCYFGAHEGDGADFGFWPLHDAIEELPHISNPSEHPANIAQDIAASALRGEWDVIAELARKLTESDCIGEDCAFVNDHGNVTVYNANGAIILELV
jgi:hypothetical protein